MDQLRIIFGRMRNAGLKVNAPKCSFGLKEVPNLGYLIKREVINPDTKKVQGIIIVGQTSITAEARALIGMVQ